LELLLLYFASATSIALTGPGNFSLDEVIIRILKSEDEEETIASTKPNSSKKVEIKEGFPDELKNIAVDFDGVIHKNSKGFYDGTIYDDPVEGARTSLERLSEDYDVVIFTAKAKPDRGLVNGKTGTQLVWEWLEEHDMAQFVTKVTAEKPRAVQYIDDKGIKFTSWEEYWGENV